jgi:drug/metabolite transporter (DMT)-like permease
MSDTPVENPVRIFMLALGSTAVFSLMNICVKLASETQSIPQIMFFRSFLSLIPILYLMLRLNDRAVFRTTRIRGHMKRAFVGIGGMGLGFLGMSMLPLAQSTAISFATPLMLTALSVPMLKEQVGIHRWGAVIVGLGAVLFMLQPFGDTTHLLGNMIALAGAFCAAFAAINVRRLGVTEHALTIVFYFTLFASAFGFILMFAFWEPLSWHSLLYLLMAGLTGGIGQVLLTTTYASAPAAYVSPFAYLGIVFATLSDIVIWQIYPGWHTIVGSIVIIACGLYVIFREMVRYGKVRVRTNVFDVTPAQPTLKDQLEPLE